MKIKRLLDIAKESPGFGQKIKQARERSGKSFEELFKETNLGERMWRSIENIESEDPKFHKCSHVTDSMIRRIESALGIDLGIDFNKNFMDKDNPTLHIEE